MKYEITIRELVEFTAEEKEESIKRSERNFLRSTEYYADNYYHERRILNAEVSKEEFEAVKKAIIGVM